jgi:hypothetical protein
LRFIDLKGIYCVAGETGKREDKRLFTTAGIFKPYSREPRPCDRKKVYLEGVQHFSMREKG